jgi:D-lactate dehydrogenase
VRKLLSWHRVATPFACFVNDDLNEQIIEQLASLGVKLIALRCAGFNNVDINAAKRKGIAVVRVPAYSPTCCS